MVGLSVGLVVELEVGLRVELGIVVVAGTGLGS